MASDKNAQPNFPTLERVIIAFQKSMARVSQATNNASKNDPDFLTGKRSLFAVESLEIEMNAGLTLGNGVVDPAEDKIRVNFDAPRETRSLIKFTVEAKPVEQISSNRLMLSRLDPLNEKCTINTFLVWFWNGKTIEPKKDVTLSFVPSGVPTGAKKVTTKTDLSGKLTFSIDPKDGKFSCPVKFTPKDFFLDMSNDWTVFAQLKEDSRIKSIILPIKKI